MPHGCTGMESPSPQGRSPPSGRCPWPSSQLVACCPPPVWASSPSGWAGGDPHGMQHTELGIHSGYRCMN